MEQKFLLCLFLFNNTYRTHILRNECKLVSGRWNLGFHHEQPLWGTNRHGDYDGRGRYVDWIL